MQLDVDDRIHNVQKEKAFALLYRLISVTRVSVKVVIL